MGVMNPNNVGPWIISKPDRLLVHMSNGER